MKQSDLKHWKWSDVLRRYSYRDPEDGDDVDMRVCSGGIVLNCGGSTAMPTVTAAVLAEAALIADHYEKTKQFAPDAEEPTREQIVSWMRKQAWVCGRDAGEVSYWGLSTSNARVLMGGAPDDNARSIDAIALITQRKREDVVREMVQC